MLKKIVVLAICLGILYSAECQKIKMCISLDPNPNSAAGIPKLYWPTGSTLRVKFMGTSSELQRQKVKEYAVKWSEIANIRFSFVNSGFADIRVSFKNDNSSWSKIGTSSQQVFESQPTMNFGWFDANTTEDDFKSTILHEFGHALGLIHEHQSPRAGISWKKEAVYAYYLRTQGWPRSVVDNNIFAKYDYSFTNSTAYDPTSIMHYPIDSRLTTNGYSVGWNTDLSALDKTLIRKAYPLASQSLTSRYTFKTGTTIQFSVITNRPSARSMAIPVSNSTPLTSINTDTLDTKNACFYYTDAIDEPLYLLDPPNDEYKKYVDEIAGLIGLAPSYTIKVGNVPNACAVFNPVDRTRYIVISQNFYENLNNKFGERSAWLAKSILAHELAHHLNGDTFDENADRQLNELKADEFSGRIMKRIGAPDLSTAQLAIKTISPIGSSIINYPPVSVRLEAIAIGWRKESGELPAVSTRNAQITYTAPRQGWGNYVTDISIMATAVELGKIIGVIYELPPNQGFRNLIMSSYDRNTKFSIRLGINRNVKIKAKIIYNDGAPQTLEKDIILP